MKARNTAGRKADRLKPPDNQYLQVSGRGEVLRRDLEGRRRHRLDVVGAEADQPIGLALVDGQFEILDRPRPVGAGLEDVADAALLHLGAVGLGGAGELVEAREKNS